MHFKVQRGNMNDSRYRSEYRKEHPEQFKEEAAKPKQTVVEQLCAKGISILQDGVRVFIEELDGSFADILNMTDEQLAQHNIQRSPTPVEVPKFDVTEYKKGGRRAGRRRSPQHGPKGSWAKSGTQQSTATQAYERNFRSPARPNTLDETGGSAFSYVWLETLEQSHTIYLRGAFPAGEELASSFLLGVYDRSQSIANRAYEDRRISGSPQRLEAYQEGYYDDNKKENLNAWQRKDLQDSDDTGPHQTSDGNDGVAASIANWSTYSGESAGSNRRPDAPLPPITEYLGVLDQFVSFSLDGPLPEGAIFSTAYLRGVYDKQRENLGIHSSSCIDPKDPDVNSAYWQGFDAEENNAIQLWNKWQNCN
jgi:hypothetical protein